MGRVMYSASLKLELDKKAEDYIKILDKKVSYKRSKVVAKRKGDMILVEITAEDPVALVASLGSFLKQVKIIGNAERLFDEK
ncbi:MAG: hypothetical protein KGH53_03335 [Candidatus Micrarchaeota archaeon]|nr:hypothetical protein [Candidatus Micrarchaeota archaeon]